LLTSETKIRKNVIVEYLDYQIPVTQLRGPKKDKTRKNASSSLLDFSFKEN